ncbi:MAG: hypothetical protein M3Z04_18950 [Chloroflexota bacterium]|nr:hypothetical protein [Chloroflexota bacterium]
MVPVLLIYVIAGGKDRDRRLYKQALLGIVALLGGWIVWIGVVDWQSGHLGTYWSLRIDAQHNVAGSVPAFFDQLVRSFLYTNNLRDKIRYSTALTIPIVNLCVLGLVPFTRERHRYALVAGTLTMLFITLYLGNPNKIIVYTTTLPGHFVSHLLFVRRLLNPSGFSTPFFRLGLAICYSVYCLAMLVIYTIGTPLGWYY